MLGHITFESLAPKIDTVIWTVVIMWLLPHLGAPPGGRGGQIWGGSPSCRGEWSIAPSQIWGQVIVI